MILTLGVFKARCYIEERTWRAVLRRDPCVYCGSEASGLDHIWPKSRGGSDHWENRVPACRSCDCDKANTPLLMHLWSELAARHHVRRRKYLSPNERRAAIHALRAKIAREFYKGNIRFTGAGRLRFLVRSARPETADAVGQRSENPT
jgi:hypothetical protein